MKNKFIGIKLQIFFVVDPYSDPAKQDPCRSFSFDSPVYKTIESLNSKVSIRNMKDFEKLE